MPIACRNYRTKVLTQNEVVGDEFSFQKRISRLYPFFLLSCLPLPPFCQTYRYSCFVLRELEKISELLVCFPSVHFCALFNQVLWKSETWHCSCLSEKNLPSHNCSSVRNADCDFSKEVLLNVSFHSFLQIPQTKIT